MEKSQKETHDKYTILEASKLEAQGYRCIIITKPIPDIIAIKGSNIEITAVEVLHKVNADMTNAKYQKATCFDKLFLVQYPIEPSRRHCKSKVRVATDGRITIPTKLRQKLGIQDNSIVELEAINDKQFAMSVLVS